MKASDACHQRLPQTDRAIHLRAVHQLAGRVDRKAAVFRRHAPTASKFSSAKPIGSIILWQAAQAGLLRCSSRRARTGTAFAPGHVFLERRHIRGRLRRRRAQQSIQHPFAAHHRRGAVGERRHRQNAALAQQPAAILIGDGHAPEAVALHVRNAVVLRQPLIDERVVRGQQVDHVAVFADDAVEEQLGFAAHGLQQIAVEVGIEEQIRLRVVQVAQIQPLPGETGGQRVGAWIGEHALHLLLQHRLVRQLTLTGQVQKLLIRRAAPQKVRKPRRQFQIADAVIRSRARSGRACAQNGRRTAGSPESAAAPCGCRNRSRPHFYRTDFPPDSYPPDKRSADLPGPRRPPVLR